MKSWEETIEMIRDQEEYNFLVEKSYFDKNLELNVKRFGESEEFIETLSIIKQYSPGASTIIDIGSGNGISAINFALCGFSVNSVEPDNSHTVGSGAIRILKDQYQLQNLKVHENFAEDIKFPANSFDVVYVRQALHHANDLTKFVQECARILKKNGLLLTVRDHVIYDSKDKEWFLKSHALHKFYGGENAFKAEQYRNAMTNAGLIIKKELKYFDSVINFYPETKEDIKLIILRNEVKLRSHLKIKLGLLSKLPFIFSFYKLIKGIDSTKILDEKKVPGRMYSYIAIKK